QAKTGIKIIKERKNFIEQINIKAKQNHYDITKGIENLEIKYECDIVDFSNEENELYKALEKITEKEIEKLSKLIAEMEICSDKKDIDNFSKYSQKFQKLIVNISGNDQLIRIRNNLSDQTIRYRIRSLSSPKRLKHSLKEHQDIFEAIKNKDSEKVEKLSKIHTENVFKNILAHIKNIHNNKELK
ncbi:MAG TPA: FCD domain-containing protein, partial [Atribacterota bacterium]|nr:FCD domain-containing protein [Atribacterota bacterium]